MTKHIGIVACSTEGAALCYRTISLVGAELMGRHAHPQVSLHSHPLSEHMKCIDNDDWQGVANLMLSSTHKVAQTGADFAICPDNTIHQALDFFKDTSPIPWLHIAEVVGAEANRRGFKRLAILGTKYLMEGPVYPSRLEPLGLEYRIPNLGERIRINDHIFDELVYGHLTDEARAFFVQVITRLQNEEGCDAAVLGCTEIPLLISDADSPVPTLDSTRLLARAAVQYALQ